MIADALLAQRDRLLADPGFRARASEFALTRPVSRRRARALFDLVTGFVQSQVLVACVRLELFALLAKGPIGDAALARHCQLDDKAARCLVDSAIALQLLQRRRDGRIGLGSLGATLVANAPVEAMVRHHAALYSDLADPVALLRGELASTRLGRLWPYARARDARGEAASARAGDAASSPAADTDPGNAEPPGAAEDVEAYSTLMAASQPLVADAILGALRWSRHRQLLDVGGGDGSFALRALSHAPSLRATVFDLPAVAQRASRRAALTGFADRLRAVGGDFRRDALPRGADIATLIRVVHDHDDADVLLLLRAVRAALEPDATLLIAEPMAATAGAESVGAYFNFYLFAMGTGRARTRAALGEMLVVAGFDRIQELRSALPLQTRILRARAARIV